MNEIIKEIAIEYLFNEVSKELSSNKDYKKAISSIGEIDIEEITNQCIYSTVKTTLNMLEDFEKPLCDIYYDANRLD